MLLWGIVLGRYFFKKICLRRVNQKIKVYYIKLFDYRPGQVLSSPAGWGPQMSRRSAHEGAKAVSPMHRPPLLLWDVPDSQLWSMLSRPQGSGQKYQVNVKSQWPKSSILHRVISDAINTQICAVGIFQTMYRHTVAGWLLGSMRFLRRLVILPGLLISLCPFSTVTHLNLRTA